MRQDLVFAWRALRRSPGFALSAVAVLGLGVGVAAAMYCVLYGVLLRPLPYSHPDTLVTLQYSKNSTLAGDNVSAPDLRDWQREAHAFEQIAYTAPRIGALQTPGGTQEVTASGASANLFATLGVAPRLGRSLLQADEVSHARVAILSDQLWRDVFQARPGAIGQTFKLNGTDFTVVGVMPPGFTYPYGDTGLWTPWNPGPDEDSRGAWMLQAIARLRDGVTPAQVQQEMSALQARIAAAHTSDQEPSQMVVRRYRDGLTANVKPALEALSGAVGLVWLIACTAIAGLLLTRIAGRRRELAVRTALGAGGWRLARQLLAESCLLGLGASLAGWGIAAAALELSSHYIAPLLPEGTNISMDLPFLLGLIAVTLLSVMAVSLAPAVVAARAPAQSGLREGSGASASHGQARLREVLVVAEIALALVLLAGAGLLLRTLFALRQIPLGFATENIVTTSLLMPQGRFAHHDMVASFDRPLLARLEALPGVQAAALTSVVPMERGFTMNGSFEFVGRKVPDDQKPQGSLRFSSPDYAAVFGIPILQGRFFDAKLDTPATPRVIVVNQAFARKYFPGQSVVGKQIGMGETKRATIIGVLADAREQNVATAPGPVIHLATSQLTPKDDFYAVAGMFTDVAVRSRGPQAALVPEVRQALHALAPDIAPGRFASMQQLVDDSIGSQILGTRLLLLFSLAALMIALAGLYGLLSYAVAQRTREIGIRVALGAEREQILGLVMARAGWLLGFGLTAGLALALAGGRVLAAYLYHVPTHDPWTLAVAALLLAATGLLAAWVPARRAARVSPLVALRTE